MFLLLSLLLYNEITKVIPQIKSTIFQIYLPSEILKIGFINMADKSQKIKKLSLDFSFSLKANNPKPIIPKNRTNWK